MSGQYGVPNTNLGAIQFDTTEITQTAHGLTVIKGTLDADLKSIITDGAGDYEAAFDVPDHIGGSVQVKVKDSQTTFIVRGSITDIQPTSVKFGEPITISGKGFDDRDTLTIVIGDQTFTISQGSVNASGNFSVPVTIGDGKWSASHNVTVSGNVSGNSVTLANEVVINPSIVLTPTLGSQNTPIQVTGHNFSGRGDVTTDEIVNIDFGTTVNIVEVRHPDFGGNLPGKFVVSFVASSQTVGGTLTVKARGTISNPDATADFLYSLPSSNRVLELSEASGSPGKADLVITGTGYPGATNVGRPVLKSTSNVVFGQSILTYTFGTDPVGTGAQIQTDVDGKFRVTAQVSSPLQAGSYTLFISEDFDGDSVLDGDSTANNNIPAPGPFDLINEDLNDNGVLDYPTPSQAFSVVPQITVNPGQSGFTGQTFSVSGLGFGANEVVDVKLSDDSVTGSVTADANGSFGAVNFPINTQTNGAKVVSATGRTSQLTAIGTQTITVLNRVSSITPSPVSVGQTITLTGDGWGSSETIEVTVLNPINLPVTPTPATSNPDGTLSISFIVPSLSGAGTFDISVRGVTTNDLQTAIDRGGGAALQWTLTPGDATFPIIDVNPMSGNVGDTVNVTIFNPPPAGSITFDGTVVVATPTAPTSTLALPTKPAGTYLIQYNSSAVPFTITGKIANVTPPDITGFANPGGGNTTVNTPVPHGLNNGDTVTISGTTNYNGTFIISNVTATTFDIPTAFVADDGTGALHVTVGDAVTVTGTGYGNQAPVTVQFDGINVGTVTSGLDGSFTATFPLPTVPAGAAHTITAVGSGQTDNFALPNTYVIGQIASLVPVIGTTLTPITLTGNGFGANETLTITFDTSTGTPSSVNLNGTALTNSQGEFTAAFTVPSKPLGAGTITATGVTSGQTSTIVFTLQPAIELIAADAATALTGVGSSGINSSTVLVTATGFATTDTAVQIHFGDDTNVTPVTQDNGIGNALINEGKFFVQFNIDNAGGAAFHPAGPTTVTAIGNVSGGSASAEFNVLGRITTVVVVSTGTTTGQVGDEVEVIGDGYARDESLIIDFGETESIPISSGDTRARDDGTFTTRFRIDKQEYGADGLKDVTVRQALGVSATQADAVTMSGRLTRILINGSPRSTTNKTIRVGDAITISGDGYSAGRRITLKLGGTTLTVATNAIQDDIVQADGGFATTFEVHQIGAVQNLDIEVDDPVVTPLGSQQRSTTTPADTDGEDDVVGLDLVGRITSVTPASGTSTTTITIAGDGFHTPATTSTITIPGIGTFGTPTITNGAFSFSGALSSLAGLPSLGPVTFDVTSTGGAPAFTVTDSNSDFILSEPSAKRIDVSPRFGTSEETIVITGTGYEKDTNVGRITFDGTAIAVTPAGIGTVNTDNTIVTDTNGAFQVEGTVPAVTGGVKQVDTSGVAALTPGTFDVRNKLIIVTPESGVGTVGGTLTVQGTGFAASEIRQLRFDAVDLTTAGHSLVSDGLGNIITSSSSTDFNKVTADPLGRFRVRFNVPAVPSGVVHTVTTDDGGVANFTIQSRLTLVSPASLQNGTVLRASGDGFRVNERIEVRFGNQIVRLDASAQGQFDTSTPINPDDSFVVGRQSHGEKSIQIIGLESGTTLTSSFTVQPRLTVEGIIGADGSFIAGTTSGQIGVGVRVRGSGFTSDDLVNIAFGTTEGIAKPVANRDGEFTSEFTVDAQAGGVKNIVAVGINNETASATFTIAARIKTINDIALSPVGFTPLDVKIGDSVTLGGDGLGANQFISQ